jgi:hypothetical protein
MAHVRRKFVDGASVTALRIAAIRRIGFKPH